MKALIACSVLMILTGLVSFDVTVHAGQAAKGTTACGLFTVAEIRQVTATKPSPIDSMRPDESTLPGGGSECEIAGFGIQLDAVPVARFEANRQAFNSRMKYERVAEVADEAYFYEQGAGTSVHVVGVYGRTATHVFTISNIMGMGESVADVRRQVLALGKAAASKLR
jgi:hypothetical protein